MQERNFGLKVAWLSGDDVTKQLTNLLPEGFKHLDGDNAASFLTSETRAFLEEPGSFDLVSAHAYIGARGIKRALDLGSDIVICKGFQARECLLLTLCQVAEFQMLVR